MAPEATWPATMLWWYLSTSFQSWVATGELHLRVHARNQAYNKLLASTSRQFVKSFMSKQTCIGVFGPYCPARLFSARHSASRSFVVIPAHVRCSSLLFGMARLVAQAGIPAVTFDLRGVNLSSGWSCTTNPLTPCAFQYSPCCRFRYCIP